MPKNRKKERVLNTLPKATCCGIEAGESGWLELWLAEHMCDVLKAGRRVRDDHRGPKEEMAQESQPGPQRERVSEFLAAAEKRIQELEVEVLGLRARFAPPTPPPPE